MSEFVDYLGEVFWHFGAISKRRMFGGFSIYHDDLMFGLVIDDVLHLKVDKRALTTFTDTGLEQFEFEMHDETANMSYCHAPEAIFDYPNVVREEITTQEENSIAQCK